METIMLTYLCERVYKTIRVKGNLTTAQNEKLNDVLRTIFNSYKTIAGLNTAQIAEELNIGAQSLYNWKSKQSNLSTTKALLLYFYICENEKACALIEPLMAQVGLEILIGGAQQ